MWGSHLRISSGSKNLWSQTCRRVGAKYDMFGDTKSLKPNDRSKVKKNASSPNCKIWLEELTFHLHVEDAG